jgi:RES domain
MTASLRSAELPDIIYRLGRQPDPWEWPDWTHAREDGTFDNRYDDPDGQYRVLYASTERQTTFRECLARFRPDLAVLAAVIEEDDAGAPPTQPPGHVKRSWLSRRLLGAATIAGTYCDVGHSESVRHLRDALAPRIIHYGLDDLDAGDLRRRAPRRLTQEISRYVFALADASGRAAFQGIRYASRLGDDLANWAIFEPNEPTALSSADIDEHDADLQAVLTDYNITFVD